MMPDGPAPIRGRWTIARDRYPNKPNGDQLLKPGQRAVNDWYATHPEGWDVVEVVPVPDEAAIERGADELIFGIEDYREVFARAADGDPDACRLLALAVLRAVLDPPEEGT